MGYNDTKPKETHMFMKILFSIIAAALFAAGVRYLYEFLPNRKTHYLR